MKESKHIDRLFQKKFKDFEATPSDGVWDRIVASQNKKDRKIIPIWLWRLGGVAALIALLITAGVLWTSSPDDQQQIVNSEKQQEQGNPVPLGPSESTAVSTNTPNTNVDIEDSNQESQVNTTDNELVETPAYANTPTNPRLRNNAANEVSMSTTIVSNVGSSSTSQQQNSNSNTSTDVESQTEKIAHQEKTTTHLEQNTTNNNNVNDELIKTDITIEKETAVTSSNEASENHTENTVSETPEENTKSLVEEAQRIALQEEEEAQATASQNKRKWDVGAVAAPVFYGDFGGSGIDPQLADNDKSRNANLSYGVQVTYAVSDKFKIRSGVSNVDLSYGTNDILFIPGNTGVAGNEVALRSVDMGELSPGIILLDRRNNGADALNAAALPGGGNINVSSGSLIQSLNYYEIPVEAIYVISDNRLGIELIGGVSTLVLNDNQIELESEGARTFFGNSTAVNDLSFTTNIGLGINYKLNERLKLNLEPSLKYQLNAFDNTVGTFRPYIIGVYTGVNYRF